MLLVSQEEVRHKSEIKNKRTHHYSNQFYRCYKKPDKMLQFPAYCSFKWPFWSVVEFSTRNLTKYYNFVAHCLHNIAPLRRPKLMDWKLGIRPYLSPFSPSCHSFFITYLPPIVFLTTPSHVPCCPNSEATDVCALFSLVLLSACCLDSYFCDKSFSIYLVNHL